jgi:hypothetical protein
VAFSSEVGTGSREENASNKMNYAASIAAFAAICEPGWSMIRKSVNRFSEKIMLKQQPKARS